jgi:hypothetical protein
MDSLNDEKTSMLQLRYKARKRNKLHAPHSYFFLVRSLPSAQRINTPQTAKEEQEAKNRNNPQNLVGMGGSSGTVSSLLS